MEKSNDEEFVQERGGNPTMLRQTPVPNSESNTKEQQMEIISDQLKAPSGQFEAAVSNLYNTGGPAIFGTQGLDLDNIDPQVFQQDLKIESKMIVNDLCLNSTFQSHLQKDNNPENVLLTSNEENKQKSSGKISVMSLLAPAKQAEKERMEGRHESPIEGSPALLDL